MQSTSKTWEGPHGAGPQASALESLLVVNTGEELLGRAQDIAQWIDVHVHHLVDSNNDPKREGAHPRDRLPADRQCSWFVGLRMSTQVS
jgi:hypothetical protein